MFWTMDDLIKFASDSNISVDIAFRAYSLAELITGMMWAYIIRKISKSAFVKKFFQKEQD